MQQRVSKIVLGAGLLVFALALAVLGWGAIAERERMPFLLGGIQVNEPDHQAWAEQLLRAGMNTVSVTVYAHQGDWDSDHLWFDDEEEHAAVIAEIRSAKQAGLRVVLILRLALDHAYEANRFLWHGMVYPASERELLSWFEQYQSFALAWAERAEAEGVDVLGIASELNTMTSTRPHLELPELFQYYLNEQKQARYRAGVLEHREGLAEHALWTAGTDGFATLESYLDAEIGAHVRWATQITGESEVPWAAMNHRRELLEERWIEVIEKIRRIYRGKLTYAANFDQYHEVGFWDQLDILGVNAYFQLRPAPGDAPPSRAQLASELEQGWARVLEDLADFRRQQGLEEMPVLFTELGYTSRRGSTVEPWASQGFSLLSRPVIAEVEAPATDPVDEPVDKPQDGADGSAPDPAAASEPTRLMVWREEPIDPGERALALEALWSASHQVDPSLLQGLLYWKLSTIPGHREIEPFVLVLGEVKEDPLLARLRRFTEPH